MAHKLKIADELALPLRAVTEKIAWMGRTGTGKSYGAMKLAELMLDAGAQIVALDPVDIWKYLRVPAQGGKSFPVYVFGGSDGDFPLSPDSGELIANLIVTRRISAVLNLSQFESDADLNRFATAFGRKFFHLKKTHRSPVHLFLEECEDFVPQNPEKDEIKKLSAFARHIWKQGRNFGIGGSLISQRPQDIHKKALGLTEIMFVFQLTSPNERKAIGEWVNEKGITENIAEVLPHLTIGHPHVWSPALLKVSETIAISKRESFDGSSTPDFTKSLALAQQLSPIDIEHLKSEMANVVAQAKEDNPAELKRMILQLKQENQKLKSQPARAEIQTREIQVPVLNGELPKLLGAIGEMTAFGNQIAEQARQQTALWQQVIAIGNKVAQIGNEIGAAINRFQRTPPARTIAPAPPTQIIPRAQTSTADYSQKKMVEGERAILIAVAGNQNGLTRKAISVITGYKASTRNEYIKRQLNRGFLSDDGSRIRATESGINELGTDFQPLPTGAELRNHWLNVLGGGQREILRVAIEAYPNPITREQVSELTGIDKPSTRNEYIKRLIAREIITDEGSAGIRASDELF